MSKVVIRGKHPVFIKNEEEEKEMLLADNEQECFYYICCHGIRTLGGQRQLVAGDKKWILLQEKVHPEAWHYCICEQLKKEGIIQRVELSDEQEKQIFCNWMDHLLIRSPKSFASDKEYGIISHLLLAGGAVYPQRLEEDDEFALIASKDWQKVCAYSRRLRPKAEVLFFQTAPIELIFAYLRTFRPQTAEAECAIIYRGDSVLTWQLVFLYSLSYEASRIIKKSGNRHIWKQAVIRNYAFEYKYEKKFGSIHNWMIQLEKSFNRKYFSSK